MSQNNSYIVGDGYSDKLQMGYACQFAGFTNDTLAPRAIKSIDATFTADNFAGIMTISIDMNHRIRVCERGIIVVKCEYGTPSFKAGVYVRILPHCDRTNIGSLDAQLDITYGDRPYPTNVLIPNARWRTRQDADRLAEIEIGLDI